MSIRISSARQRAAASSVFNQGITSFSARHLAGSRARLAAAALAGIATMALAGSAARAQLMYEPFDYGTNAESGAAANYANTTGTFQGYVNPMNGLAWFSANDAATSNDHIFAGGSLGPISGLAAPVGDSAGSDTRNLGTMQPRIGVMPSPITTTGSSMFYSFTMQVPDLGGLTNTGSFIAAGFNNTTGAQSGPAGVVGTRLMLRLDGSDPSKYNIGVAANNASPTIQWTPDAGSASGFKQFSTSDKVFVVGEYQIVLGLGGNNDVQSLWVNPSSSTFGAGTAPTATVSADTGTVGDLPTSGLGSFLIRTTTSTTPNAIRYDEIRLDSTWAQVTPPSGSVFTGGSSTNWGNAGAWDAGGVPDGAAKFAYLNGAGGTLNVEANHTIGTLTFRSSNAYTIAGTGGTLNFNGDTGGTAAINVQPKTDATTGAVLPASHTISAPVALQTDLAVHTGVSQSVTLSGGITGTANITKDGPGTLVINNGDNHSGGISATGGTLVLKGTNGFTGPVSFIGQGASGGTPNVLEIDGDAALGAVPASPTNDLILSKPSSGMTLKFDADTSLNANRTIQIALSGGGNGPTIDTNGHTVTINGSINLLSGGANLLVDNLTTAGGTLNLRATNGFGALFINGGVVNVDAADRLGTAGLQLNGNPTVGTLQLANSITWGSKTLGIGGSGGNIDTNGHDQLIDGTFSGGGAFKKLGAGNLTFTSAAGRTGTTTVADGTLTLKTAIGTNDVTVLAGPTPTSLVVDSSQAAVNVIGDSAAVTLAATGGSGIMNLPSGYNDTVSGLVINGVAQTQNGTYGATGSGATFINDNAFTGTGVLNLQLTRTLYWDVNGTTAGAGNTPATPTGTWTTGGANTFNTDSTGGAGGIVTGTSIATDPVVFAAGSDGTGTYTVTVTGPQKAGSVSIARGNVTFAGTGSIATPTIDVATGSSATVSATLAGGVVGNSVTKTGLGTLTLSGANTHTGGTTVSTGALIAANADAFGGNTAGPLSIANGATAQLQASLPKATQTGAVSTTGSGFLDITNNAMVVRNTTQAAVRASIVSGFNGGAWNGPGINSSTAAADANGLTAIGYASNADYGASDFHGVSGLTANDVLLRYTYYGDADLDGTVTLDDFSQFLNGYQTQSAATNNWLNGDFDYDGAVTLDDFSQFLFGYQHQGAPLGALESMIESSGLSSSDKALMLAAVEAVPEPTGLALLGLAGAGLLARRRRHLCK